jgi:hypothetical protein
MDGARHLLRTLYYDRQSKLYQILKKSTVHCRTNKSQTLVPTLSKMNPVRALPSYFVRSILILWSTNYAFKTVSVLHVSPLQVCRHFFPLCAACTAYVTILEVITLIISGAEYGMRNSSL